MKHPSKTHRPLAFPCGAMRRSFRFLATALTLALVTAVAQAQTGSEPKPASQSTIEFKRTSTASFPWSDKLDFENAKRGLIARLPDNGVIKNKNGRVVWDLSNYTSFIKDTAAAPDAVNPSLWRISQLLMEAGLYEVVPGVYQVRGADLSNLTIVEGENGITIYDPLISGKPPASRSISTTSIAPGNPWWPWSIRTPTSITLRVFVASWTRRTSKRARSRSTRRKASS